MILLVTRILEVRIIRLYFISILFFVNINNQHHMDIEEGYGSAHVKRESMSENMFVEKPLKYNLNKSKSNLGLNNNIGKNISGADSMSDFVRNTYMLTNREKILISVTVSETSSR